MLVLLETPYEMSYDAAQRFPVLWRRKNVSMKALSAQSGVAYSTLRHFESSSEISFLSLVKLASALLEASHRVPALDYKGNGTIKSELQRSSD